MLIVIHGTLSGADHINAFIYLYIYECMNCLPDGAVNEYCISKGKAYGWEVSS